MVLATPVIKDAGAKGRLHAQIMSDILHTVPVISLTSYTSLKVPGYSCVWCVGLIGLDRYGCESGRSGAEGGRHCKKKKIALIAHDLDDLLLLLLK